ncbi:hypothetical protein B0T11DRAFT_336494 [Plectosphaerella cucumerina]|uniref:ZZ-type domain-containing protein n=1 Tax=Plectosphaerella cucumerina TaxID=40658 RepID=A0A8K0X600_9PEZI|nr:hypothetical protein B0T11DRAFT_336494 [Plectosphaerella cucumerina]
MAGVISNNNKFTQEKVMGWHASIADTVSRSVASRICLECTEALKAILGSFAIQRVLPKAAVRNYKMSCSSFILWVDGYSIHQGGLDRLLNNSGVLSKLLHKCLARLCNLLTEKLIPGLNMEDMLSSQVSSLRTLSAEAKDQVQHFEVEDDDDDEDEEGNEDGDSDATVSSDDNSETEAQSPALDGILKDLAIDVRCLLDLSPLIEAPLPAFLDKGKAVVHESSATLWVPYQAYKDRIYRRFPTAHPAIADRLGKINLERFQRLQQQKWLATIPTFEEDTGDHQTVAGQSRFNDSGLGTSLATGSIYAETVMCYGDDGDALIRVPGLSKTAKAGEPFDCLACGMTMIIKTDKSWKHHLYQDLRPWVCLFPGCVDGSKPFNSKEKWLEHMAIGHGLREHWATFDCSLCGERAGRSQLEVIRHLTCHLEEISLAVLQKNTDGEGIPFDEDNDEDDAKGFPISPSARTPKNSKTEQVHPSILPDDFVGRKPTVKLLTCNYCDNDFAEYMSMHCTMCKDFNLCQECLAEGAHGHNPKHTFLPVITGSRVPEHISKIKIKLPSNRNQ